jgi:NAD(P)H-dependent FMN reductase
MTENKTIAVIASSVRGERLGRVLADWAVTRVAATGAATDLIDLAECDLPDDALLRPGGGTRTVIADRIEAADGFVVVTPEYNHSYPAGLKRAIDWHYREWMFKPATMLTYGVQGGLLAGEHLRGVFAELYVVTTRRVVGLSAPWNQLTAEGYRPADDVAKAFDLALGELTWWSQTLATARRDRPYAA